MYKFNEEAFKRYFFHGDSNPNGTIDGILYFVYVNEMHYIQKMNKINKKTIETEDEIKEFSKEAANIFKQYHRFVELNNIPGVYNFYRKEREGQEKGKEDILQKRMKEKIEKTFLPYFKEKLREYAHFPEHSVKLAEKDSHRFARYSPYDGNKWWKDEQYKPYMDNEEKIENDYEGQKYIPHILRHWTEDVYDILKFLKQLEQDDNNAYIDLWLRTRLNRAKNGTIEGIQEKEIKRLEHACEKIRKIRLEEERKNKSQKSEEETER